jgi:hypothetical protein
VTRHDDRVGGYTEATEEPGARRSGSASPTHLCAVRTRECRNRHRQDQRLAKAVRAAAYEFSRDGGDPP